MPCLASNLFTFKDMIILDISLVDTHVGPSLESHPEVCGDFFLILA